MRIVVTGVAGFIGSHLCEALLGLGHEVVGIDAFTDYYSRDVKKENLSRVVRDPRFRLLELDLRYDNLHRVLEGVQGVVHLAAMPGLPRSWVEFREYSSCNVLATQRIASASSEVGVPRFVHASTSSVYGLSAVGDESVPLRPVSPYGITKLAAEHLIEAYAETRGLQAVIVRYFSIYGPRQRPDMAYHIFAEALLDRRPITITGDGHQSRSSTHVSDCVQGTIRALQNASVGRIYNIGGGESLTLLEALDILAKATGQRPMMSFVPARPGDQLHTRADTSLAARELGYIPQVSAREGLLSQVSWHRQRRAAMIDLRDATANFRAENQFAEERAG